PLFPFCLSTLAGAVARPGADYNVFSGRCHFDFPILAVVSFVGWVITDGVLSSKFSRYFGEGVRQRTNRISAQNSPARFVRQLEQIAIGFRIECIQHSTNRIVVAAVATDRARRTSGKDVDVARIM